MRAPRSTPTATEPQAGVPLTGRRGIVTFHPSPASHEVLTAGAVLQLTDGSVAWRCAIDERKAGQAFGARGQALHAIAQQLCLSLAEHWKAGERKAWRPPFEGAELAQAEDFSARDADSAFDFTLGAQSSLYGLLEGYELDTATRPQGIVRQVQQAVKQQRAQHLQRRFGRELNMGSAAGTLRVDFLGQHYACYFLALTHSARGVEGNTERALAKLYELQALQRFVQARRPALGLLDEERPASFELLTVGDPHKHAVQRQALARIELLADHSQVRLRPLRDVPAAAEHVVQMERQAA